MFSTIEPIVGKQDKHLIEVICLEQMKDKKFKSLFFKNLDLFCCSKFLVEKLLWEGNIESKLKNKIIHSYFSNLRCSYLFFESASLCFKREAHEIELKKYNLIRRGLPLVEKPTCFNCNRMDIKMDFVQFVSCGHGYHKECLKINKHDKFFKCFKCSI